MGAFNFETYQELYKSLCIDKKMNSFRSFVVLLFYRLEHFLYHRKFPPNGLFLKVLYFVHEIVYFILSLNASISYRAIIGNYIRLPHCANGVVISSRAVVGNHITIFHQVTIGINESLPKEEQVIVIGDYCYLAAGCKVISSRIGNNVKVGPNAVVYHDLPDNSIWVSQNLSIGHHVIRAS